MLWHVRVAALFVTVLATPLSAQGVLEVTERVSLGVGGVEGDAMARFPVVSAQGRYVAFESDATNLVPGDTNGVRDVFVLDRELDVLTRVSVDSAGVQGNGDCLHASISADGALVAYSSLASNLVPGDTNGVSDIFVHELATGQTRRASIDSAGAQGNDHSYGAQISGDGGTVAFWSFATNLDPPDTTPFFGDVFVHELASGRTTMESVDSAGVQGNLQSIEPAISFDGSILAFESMATNLVPGDTNNQFDIFVRDRNLGTTERVSISSGGAQSISFSREAAISADGSTVAFWSWASNLVGGDTNLEIDVFVRDRVAGTTERVSVDSYGVEGNEGSYSPSLSEDGRFVAFYTNSDNLVPGDANQVDDVFVRDRLRGFTHRVSLASDAAEGDETSHLAQISADGRFVVFESFATNLVLGDTNGVRDAFLHDRRTNGIEVEAGPLIAGGSGTFTLTGATPGGAVLVGFSTAGASAWGSPVGVLHLATPYQTRTLVADAQGGIVRSFFLSPALAGSPLWFQAVDLTSRFPSSVAPGRVQ